MDSTGRYPRAIDESLVGGYPALAGAGGGYVWDAVLEYRVWCHPLAGAPHVEEDNDYFRAFSTYEDALAFAERTEGAEEPLALVLQEEYIDEPAPQQFVHVRKRRITEWPIDFLDGPRRTPRTIPDFLASKRV
jgi:putative acetyltransferase